MVDHVTPQRRSAMMSGVRGKDTAPEMLVRRAAHALGLRFRLHDRRLPGRPDLVFPRWRSVVFVNGCFWHRHAGCRRATLPKSNIPFWAEKIDANAARDAASYAALAEAGWRVLIVWECEVRTLSQATTRLTGHFRPLGPEKTRQGADEEP